MNIFVVVSKPTLNRNFENGIEENISNLECEYNTPLSKEKFTIINNIIPYRREGNFDCMYHVDEGFVNGKWAKGETTAKNEKRYVLQMQQGKINYKNEGINSIK